MSRIPLLTTDGDSYDCGVAHGRRFAREVADNLETYLRRFAASGLGRDAAFAEAERWMTAMRSQNTDYADEMQGIADGSRQSAAAIALLNARYELAFTLFGQEVQSERKSELLSVGPDGCTTFGVLPQAAANRHTWLGQNWDWLEGIHGRTLVLRVRRKSRPSFVCLTEAGIAGGKMGVNECGIGLVENGLASSHDGRNPYQRPFHMRCREVLDADSFAGAKKAVTGSPRTCSANFVIGMTGGDLVDIETSPDHVSEISAEDGIVTHSNHFLTRDMANRCWKKFRPTRCIASIGCVICYARVALPSPSTRCAAPPPTIRARPMRSAATPTRRSPAPSAL